MKMTIALLTALVLLSPALDAATVEVRTTLQAAVDAAQPGDTIHVPSGLYRENVRVTKSNLTIRGSRGAVLDGTGLSGTTGIRVSATSPTERLTGFTLSGLTIQNYPRTGVLLSRVDNYTISDGRYRDNRVYAIFPIRCDRGLIASNHVTGSEDSGIYVGQSSRVVVQKNLVTDCRVGFEIENSSLIDVLQNTATDNSIGIFVFVLPGLDVSATSDIRVLNNTLLGNNRPLPPLDPDDPFAQIPRGVGLANAGGDNLLASHNVATHNDSAGILISELPAPLASLDPRIDPFPDKNEIRGNVTLHNGANIDPLLAPLPGSDLLWTGSGASNCWSANFFKTAFPVLPACLRSRRPRLTARVAPREQISSGNGAATLRAPALHAGTAAREALRTTFASQLKRTERQQAQIHWVTGREVRSLELRLHRLPEPTVPIAPEPVVIPTRETIGAEHEGASEPQLSRDPVPPGSP